MARMLAPADLDVKTNKIHRAGCAQKQVELDPAPPALFRMIEILTDGALLQIVMVSI